MFSDIPESVLIICVADYSQSILPFYGTVVEHIELFDDIQYRALSHYHEMKCLYLIRYISAIQQPNRKSKRKTLWTVSFRTFTFAKETVQTKLQQCNWENKLRTRTAFSKCILFRTKLSHFEYLKQKSSTPLHPTPQKNILILSVNTSLDQILIKVVKLLWEMIYEGLLYNRVDR